MNQTAEDIPELIRAAGEPAARAYREFLDDPKRSPRTRSAYRQSIGRFLRWAEARALSLDSIDAPALFTYAAEIAAAKSSPLASTYLTPARGLIRHLIAAGILTARPLPPRAAARPNIPPAKPKKAPRMSPADFERIGKRFFPASGQQWKHSVARALERSWNTIWCYASGRRAIPPDVAEEVREWDRMLNEAIATLEAETPEQKLQRLLRFLDERQAVPTHGLPHAPGGRTYG
jgi:hypothetical protein